MNNQTELFPSVPNLSRRSIVTASALAIAGFSMPARSWPAVEDGISNSSESIHQEPVFQADRKRIYEALTNARQFDHIVQLSEAMKSGALSSQPAEISTKVGGAFSIFGGHIVGRHLDLTPNERIVQAWRERSWEPGEYSIVSFKLVEHGPGTKIVFDHKGFPAGAAPHLAIGWRGNYWEPLEKYLAQK
ncbi:MAG TPA: SRPBCC domain-containing protein [Terriglobales bacterium]|nr:SRPBCC domain-containing protein [Terriglobales bacterium]